MTPRALLAAVVAALAAAAAPAAGAGTQPAPAGPDTRTMVLRLSDLPQGFGRAEGVYVTNSDLDKLSGNKDYEKLGRLGGYRATYRRFGIAGILGVDAFASIYRSSTGAHDSYAQSLAGALQDGGPTFRWLPLKPRLGSETRVYLVTEKQSGMRVDYYTIAWRHGRVFAEVIGGGVSGRITLAQVVALARKQEARIVEALD
jgi:hypothetical protein